MIPTESRATMALAAARTRTASIFSSIVAGVSRGAGGGRIEKEVVVVDSGTATWEGDIADMLSAVESPERVWM
jgi:hypothetical protein